MLTLMRLISLFRKTAPLKYGQLLLKKILIT
nr:MAG TPA: hypothetical protein [Caudoviricetes sp.]